jgi:hypothetical protein
MEKGKGEGCKSKFVTVTLKIMDVPKVVTQGGRAEEMSQST